MCVICNNPHVKIDECGLCEYCNKLLCLTQEYRDPLSILKTIYFHLGGPEANFGVVFDFKLSVVDVFPITKDGIKICSKCKRPHPGTAKYFHRNRNCRDGLDPQCKICKRLYFREHYLKKTYGMSLDDFNKMREEQNNCCFICRKPFVSTPSIDHDHNTNKVRVLLCVKCNLLLAYGYENPEFFLGVSNLLKEWQK